MSGITTTAVTQEQAQKVGGYKQQVFNGDVLLEECKAVLCRLGLCHPGYNEPDDQAMDQYMMLTHGNTGSQTPMETQPNLEVSGQGAHAMASSNSPAGHAAEDQWHHVQANASGCYSQQAGSAHMLKSECTSQEDADYMSARDQLEPPAESQHSSKSMPVTAAKKQTAANVPSVKSQKRSTGPPIVHSGDGPDAKTPDDGDNAVSMHSVGSWHGCLDVGQQAQKASPTSTGSDAVMAAKSCRMDSRGYWGSHDGQALQLSEHAAFDVVTDSQGGDFACASTVATTAACAAGQKQQQQPLAHPDVSWLHHPDAVQQCNGLKDGAALPTERATVPQQQADGVAEQLPGPSDHQGLPCQRAPARKRSISCSEGGGTAVRSYPRLNTRSTAGFSAGPIGCTDEAGKAPGRPTPSKVITVLCSTFVEAEDTVSQSVRHALHQACQAGSQPQQKEAASSQKSHASLFHLPRPASVPRLNLSKLNLGVAMPPVSASQQAAHMMQAGIEVEEGDDMEDELAGWAAPATWLPKNEGRCYVFTPVSSKMVQQNQELRAALPAHLLPHLDDMWNSLIEARYACEQIASRGVRVVKDITREWSEISTQLIQRIETAEAAFADMEMHCQQQAALVHHLNSQLKLAQQVAAQSQATTTCMYPPLGMYYPPRDMLPNGQLVTSPTPTPSYYTSPLHSSSTVVHSPSLMQPQLPATALGHPGACLQHAGNSCVYLGTTTTSGLTDFHDPAREYKGAIQGTASWAAPSSNQAHMLSCHNMVPAAVPVPPGWHNARSADRGVEPGGQTSVDAAYNLMQQHMLAANSQCNPATYGFSHAADAGGKASSHAAMHPTGMSRMGPSVEVFAMGFEDVMASHGGYSLGGGSGSMAGMLPGMHMGAPTAWG